MAKKKNTVEEIASMKPEVTDVPPASIKSGLAKEMAASRRLPMITKDSFDKLAATLAPLGFKFEVRESRSGAFKSGKEPFGAIVKTNHVTFIVDLT